MLQETRLEQREEWLWRSIVDESGGLFHEFRSNLVGSSCFTFGSLFCFCLFPLISSHLYSPSFHLLPVGLLSPYNMSFSILVSLPCWCPWGLENCVLLIPRIRWRRWRWNWLSRCYWHAYAVKGSNDDSSYAYCQFVRKRVMMINSFGGHFRSLLGFWRNHV